MCLKANIYAYVSLIIGISIIIFSNWLLIKKGSNKWIIVILDIILGVITYGAFGFFINMFC